MTSNRSGSLFGGVDRLTVLFYALIVLAGWVSIAAATYDETLPHLFSFAHFYMKQVVWIAVAAVVALFVLLLDDRYYHMWAYPAYIIGLLLLLSTLVIGKEINGAKAWISFGSFNVQPVEFAKIATALATARLMSEYTFNIARIGDLVKVGLLLCVPLIILFLIFHKKIMAGVARGGTKG